MEYCLYPSIGYTGGMKKTAIFVILGLLGLALFATLVLSTGVDALVQSVKHISIPALLIFTAISIINFVLFTFKWQAILRTSGEKIPHWYDLTLFRLSTFALSYLIPSAQVGGEPARIYLLEKRGVSRDVAVSSVIIDKVFELSINVIFAVITLFILFLNHTAFEQTGILIIGLAVLLLSFFYYKTVVGNGFFLSIFHALRLNRLRFFARFEKPLVDTEHTIQTFFRHHILALIITLVYSTLCFLLILLEYFVIFYFLGITPTFSQLLIVTILPLVGYIIPVPGAVGTLEATQVTAVTLAGLDPVLAFPIIVIIRARDLVFVGGGLLYTYTQGFSLLRGKK